MKKQTPIIILAALAVSAIVILKLQKTEVKIDYGLLIQTHADQARGRNTNAFDSFELEVDRILVSHKPKLEEAAKEAAKEGADYKSCCLIIYYLAWDKMKETSKTEGYLDAQIFADLVIVKSLFHLTSIRAKKVFRLKMKRAATVLFNLTSFRTLFACR